MRRTVLVRVNDRNKKRTYCGDIRCYGELSLRELAESIIQCSNKQALKEFHDNRHLFRARDNEHVLMADFTNGLCDTPWARTMAGGNHAVLELAYDLTIDKFSSLPPNDWPAARTRVRGPDCRYYFRGFLRVAEAILEQRRITDPIQQEITAAGVLQGRVVHHFRLSCLAARRKCNPARSRYAWSVNGGKIYAWMPTSMSGRQRREWLNSNVNDPDPRRSGERYRVQAIVDEQLGTSWHLSLDDEIDHIESPKSSHEPLESLIDKEVSVRGLANVVADEKVRNLRQQRPSIRALGKSTLKQLILHIFDDLSEETYKEGQLADSFGLSEAALSRFAGSRWHKASQGQVPDLWMNTAEMLASHAAFTEAAEEAGVLGQVEQLLHGGSDDRRHTDAG